VGAIDILLLCTANQCRSPMAEVLLRSTLADRGVEATVSSAGLFRGGVPASPGSVRAMARRGLDLDAHRSRTVTAELLDGADLVVGMARLHVKEAVLAVPDVWPRAFTLKELVRRGAAAGPRPAGEPVADWLARLHEGRRRADLIGDDPADDVADPIGGPDDLYLRTADELELLVRRLADLAFPIPVNPDDRLGTRS
jgi:protein-tyrosine phosphatase